MIRSDWTVPASSAGYSTIAKTYEITVRMAQAYAAGTGDYNPRYFNDHSPEGIVAPPCLVYRLQWNAREMREAPRETVPPTQYVHAGSDIRFQRLMRPGDVITVQGKRVAVAQRPPGVYVLTRYEMRDSTGALVAVSDDSAIARDARVDGEEASLIDSPPSPRPDGTEIGGWSTTVNVAREAAHVYTECADIWNPIHTERRIALAAGLPDIILQGSATLAVAARELVNRIASGDPSRLARLAGQLRAMVIPGEDIQVVSSGIRVEGEDGIAFFEVLNASGQPAVKNGVAVFRRAAIP